MTTVAWSALHFSSLLLFVHFGIETISKFIPDSFLVKIHNPVKASNVNDRIRYLLNELNE